MVKSIDTTFLEDIQKIDLRWIEFVNLNNKITPITKGTSLFKVSSDRVKILLYISKLIADNIPKKIYDIVKYLETSETKQIETLKLINEECIREPLIKKFIIEQEFPYKISELEKIMEKDPYIIKNEEDWSVRNLVFEFIEKVSKTTWFLFSSKQPRTIWQNMTAVKDFLKLKELTLDELNDFFDKVYVKFLYDWFVHKSVKYFLNDAWNYFDNKEHSQIMIKSLMVYLTEKNEKTTPMVIWSTYNKDKNTLESILSNIWWNFDTFQIIIKDFARKYKSNQLNWNLWTLFRNIHTQYWKYVILNNNDTKTNDNEINNELLLFLKEKNITDKDVINEIIKIYNKDWIDSVKTMFK